MNRRLKVGLQTAFEAPKPDKQEKDRFLRTLPQPRISMLQFILMQAAYLRKRTLILSLLLLFIALDASYWIGTNTLWAVSDFIPFLALLAVAESTRSMRYGMGEFEMYTRFSLKSVVLARMGVLGMLDVVTLCGCIPLCYIGRNAAVIPVLQTAIYLFVPYLLTVNVCLWITRHFRGREAVYACMGIAALVSAVNAGLHFFAGYVYQSAYFKWWLILSALSAGAVIYETYRTIKQTEEPIWSL